MAEGRDVPRPEELAFDEAVHAGGGRVLFRVARPDDGIGGEVDPRPLDPTEVELVDAGRMGDLHLEAEAVVGRPEDLDRPGRREGLDADTGQHAGAAVTRLGRAFEPPVAGLARQRRVLVVEQPGERAVVQEGQAVVAEADALPELVGAPFGARFGVGVALADLVVDDAGALPDADQPREGDELGRQVGGDVDHGAVSADP